MDVAQDALDTKALYKQQQDVENPVVRQGEDEDDDEDDDDDGDEPLRLPPPVRRNQQPRSRTASTSCTFHPTIIPPPYTATKAPKDTLKAVYKAGKYKAGLTLNLLCIQSFMAGVYIAMAGHVFLQVNGGVLGAAFFPTGLIAVVLTSGELFTGDALVFVASVLGRQVSLAKLVRNWTVAWTFNFLGCLTWAYLLAYSSDALDARKDLVLAVALRKATAPWRTIFLRGIGANFLVCIGLWQATCAEEVAGKVLAMWFPITAFVVLGFEHVIANQFFLPLGMLYGADISVYRLFVQALLPATLGNIVGGGFVGAVNWYVFEIREESTHNNASAETSSDEEEGSDESDSRKGGGNSSKDK